MIETREYPVPLTEEELKTAAEFVGLIHKRIQEKDAAFEEIRQEYKHSIKELRSGLAAQLEKLSTRREVREVELEILYNSPEKGMKQIFLNSTGALIDTVEMTADDEQDLFADAESREESDGSDGSDESEEEDRENPAPEGVGETGGAVCSVCGITSEHLYHINYGKVICYICMLKLPQEKRVKELLDSGHPFSFRASAGFGNVSENNDTTNFRFIDHSPEAAPEEPWRVRSWGMGIWRPGNFLDEGTPAYEFYQLLQLNPNGTEN